MITFVERENINDQAWDRCITNAFNGLIYGYTWYLDSVTYDWSALILGDYEAVMPLPLKHRLWFKQGFQPFWTQQLGIFSTSTLAPELIQRFIRSIPESFVMAHWNFNSHMPWVKTKVPLKRNTNHLLPLIHPYEELSGNYHSNTKRNLKRASGKQLALAENVKPEQLVSIFRETSGHRYKHLKDSDYKRLVHLTYRAITAGKGMAVGVFNGENVICGGAIFLFSHQRVYFAFSALTQEGKESGAMTFLIDRIIQKFAHSDLILDFEGSNNETLARFYKGFGAEESGYYSFRKGNELAGAFTRSLLRPLLRLLNFNRG